MNQKLISTLLVNNHKTCFLCNTEGGSRLPLQQSKSIKVRSATGHIVTEPLIRPVLITDPYTLLNDLDLKIKYFSVTDLANTFFSVPVHRNSQFWFAFQFEGKKYTYTRIPQGYYESPTSFSMAISSKLAKFDPTCKIQMLLYVDDILIASKTEKDCKTDTLALLRF